MRIVILNVTCTLDIRYEIPYGSPKNGPFNCLPEKSLLLREAVDLAFAYVAESIIRLESLLMQGIGTDWPGVFLGEAREA